MVTNPVNSIFIKSIGKKSQNAKVSGGGTRTATTTASSEIKSLYFNVDDHQQNVIGGNYVMFPLSLVKMKLYEEVGEN